MSDSKPELKTCSRCHSKLLLQYFETNRIGELYKLCNNCRMPKTAKEERTERIANILKRICKRCHLSQDTIAGFGLNKSGGVYRLCKECREEEPKRATEHDRTHLRKWNSWDSFDFLHEFDERLNHPIQHKLINKP